MNVLGEEPQKGMFEKTIDFEKRKQVYIDNKEKLTQDTNKKYQKELNKYYDEMNMIKRKIKTNQKRLSNYISSKVFDNMYGIPVLNINNYDADSEAFKGSISSEEGSFKANISGHVPIDTAESFFKSKTKSSKVIYEFNESNINLKGVEILFNNNIYKFKINSDKNINHINKIISEAINREIKQINI